MKLTEWVSSNPLKPYRIRIDSPNSGGSTRLQALQDMEGKIVDLHQEVTRLIEEEEASVNRGKRG